MIYEKIDEFTSIFKINFGTISFGIVPFFMLFCRGIALKKNIYMISYI